MTDLIDLMLSPRARNSDPITSHEAGAHSRSFSSSDRADIYGAMRLSKRPLAAEEISDLLGWDDHVRVNRRLKELAECVTDEYGALVRGALIAPTEELHTNKSGRKARRYRVLQPA